MTHIISDIRYIYVSATTCTSGHSLRFRSNLEMDVKIDKDPELFNLTAEARRLSMGGSARRTAEMSGNEFSSSSPARASSPKRRDSLDGELHHGNAGFAKRVARHLELRRPGREGA